MKHRSAMVLAAAAGLAVEACGQEVMQVSYSWSEVVAGTLTPVASPNSVLEPGEGARIHLSIVALRDGVDVMGMTATYQTPPGPGVGTVRGIGHFIYSLDGSGGSATGTWSNLAISPILNAGAFGGNPLNGGATLDSFGGGQFLPAGQTSNATSPIAPAFRGVWTPTTYATRTVNFKGSGHVGPAGLWNGIILQYGTAFLDPSDPTTEYALYYGKDLQTNFGTGVNIPIAPAPAGVLVLGVLGVGRRRGSGKCHVAEAVSGRSPLKRAGDETGHFSAQFRAPNHG